MTAPQRRPEPHHLDPDPRYPDEIFEQMEHVDPRDVETREEFGAAGRLFVMLLAIGIAFAVAYLLTSWLDSQAPRGAPDGAASPTAPALGLPGAPAQSVAPEDVAIAGPLWAGTATWYCSSTSACTRGYGPGDMVAAIDTDLGIPKGSLVEVRFGKRAVTVRIVDVCACAGERLIDLTSGAFRRLAPLSYGVLPVTIEVLGAGVSRGTLPPTDVQP